MISGPYNQSGGNNGVLVERLVEIPDSGQPVIGTYLVTRAGIERSY